MVSYFFPYCLHNFEHYVFSLDRKRTWKWTYKRTWKRTWVETRTQNFSLLIFIHDTSLCIIFLINRILVVHWVLRPRLILEGQLKCLIWKMTFKCHYSWFFIIHKVQWHNWNLLLIHLIPSSHFFKYFSKKHNLIWPYFEYFNFFKLINLLELYFDTYFWMDFASVLCTIFEQLLPYGGYLTTETNVE